MIMALDRLIHRYVLLKHPFFKTSADDVLKWMPFGVLLFADILGKKTTSGWKRQVLIAGAGEAIKYLISDNLKKITNEHRPAPYTGSHSFPSGHTCTAFSTAEVLHSEFKDSLPWLSYSGYVIATAVAAIRVMKNRHWLQDVVAGAAIGIISTKLAYALVNKLTSARPNREKLPETKAAK
jgi:membrane-associated phospholipid phosphatase